MLQRAVHAADVIDSLPRTLDAVKLDLKFIDESHKELVRKFPDQWIAVKDLKVVASASTLDELRAALVAMDVNVAGCALEFLPVDPPLLIL
jgi:hypothetical protein